jgi:DNA-binding XRE family transcriptional regulator
MNKLDIKALRKEFNMSQDELARRLNLSRPTLINIEKGVRKLKLDEIKKVKEIFELIGAHNEKTESDTRISIPQKNLKKFKQVFLYILNEAGGKPNVGLTVLYKLLYFIDFDYYEKYEEQLMGLTYIKNHHGPTPKEFIKVIESMKQNGEIEEVKSKYFTFEQRKYLPLPGTKVDLSKLNGQELEIINSVLTKLSDKTATQLSDYSHEDVPWKSHELGEEINYESVFYRNDAYSVKEFDDEL